MKNLAKIKPISVSMSSNNPSNEDQSVKTSNSIKVPVFLISVLGTIVEYFEYAIYGFLAPILATHFFADDDPASALLKTFGVFAVGSLSKPLGAFIFGYLGDTQGRRISLRYSMIGISFPTFIVGILPGYASWGWGAAFALVLCRILQGIFIAGESDGVRIYIFEHFGKKYPCLINTLVGCGAYIGIALASLVASQIPVIGDAWRLVFLSCSLCGIIVFFLRRYLIETPPFLAYQEMHFAPISLNNVIGIHWRSILKTIMICGAGGGAYHFYLVFQGTYHSKILHLAPLTETSLRGFYLTCAYICALPLAGWFADLLGLSRIAKIGGSLSIMLVTVNIVLIVHEIVLFPLMIVTTIAIAFFFTPGYLYLMRQFDIGIRFRGLSIGHAIGSMLFSGTTPFVCLLLWQKTTLSHVPYLYFLSLLIMGLIAFFWEEKKQNSYAPSLLLSS